MEQTAHEPQATLPVLTDGNIETLIDALRRDPGALAEVISRAGPDDGRSDGWTPFARRFFLQTLAETGRVSEACRWTQLSRQSAYALRARDPVFAAGWDAACEIARTQLADALFEKAIDGVTETITKDGEVVAKRHRFDSRLSIAVLHRLDKRCDRSIELGSEHLAVVRNWEQFLTHIGRDEEQAAQALLQTAPHGQLGQLPLGENPTTEEDEPEEMDLSDRCWKDEDEWMTDFPPPPGFTGYQHGSWRDHDYQRVCTPEEAAILEADEASAAEDELADEETLRNAWFQMLSRESGPASDLEDVAPDAEEQEDKQDVVDDQELPEANHPAFPAFVGGIAADDALREPDQGRDHQHEVDGEAPQDAAVVAQSPHSAASVDGKRDGPDGQDQTEDEEHSVGIVAHRRFSPQGITEQA